MALILLDAFGRRFLTGHAGHPAVGRLAVTPLRSQFPSTTTAHVTTLHFGKPVTEHGLYEWNVYEPALDEVICPLRFCPAGAPTEGELAGRLDPSALGPGPTFYESLAVPSFVLEPAEIVDSAYTRLATRGADVIGFGELGEGLDALGSSLRRRRGGRYALLYWDGIDAAGHSHGPVSAEFEDACTDALDAVWEARRGLKGVTVLVCADHGQVEVAPDRVDYLDALWPELPELLSQPRCAGSSRDVFLHVRAGRVEEVIEGLVKVLGDRARVCRAEDLFEDAGPRLTARLGDVAVLPTAGRQAWMHSCAAGERWFRGQHGGLDPAETETVPGRAGRLTMSR